jgi:hypothetical protein
MYSFRGQDPNLHDPTVTQYFSLSSLFFIGPNPLDSVFCIVLKGKFNALSVGGMWLRGEYHK